MLFTKLYMKKLKWNGLTQSVLWGCMGIAFILLYPVSPQMTSIIGGCMLLIQGLPQLYLFIQEDERFIYSLMALIACIIVCFLGVWLITKPEVIHDIVPAVFSFVVLLRGLSDALIYIRLKGFNFSKSYIALFICVVKILFAVILMTQFEFAHFIMYSLTALAMVLDGISDAWLWMVLEKKVLEDLGI